MSFVRTKTINGRQYKYLVSGVRDGTNVRQKVVKYLGPVEPKYRIGKKREKTNASIYARALSDEERSTIVDTSMRSPEAFMRDRARIILVSSQERLFARQIAERMICDERKVRLAIKAFNEKGLDALQRRKAPGARPKFTSEVKQVILMHFAKSPHDFNYAFTTWTLPRLRKHLIEYSVVESISMEQLRQILLKAKAKLKKSKRWQYSPDPELDKKNKG